MQNKIDITQRKMLRRIVGWVRIPNELWATTMHRMNGRLQNAMRQHPVKPWSNRIADAKWKYVHRLKKMDHDKWPVLACRWRPDMVIDPDYIAQPKRKQGHPLLR